MEITWYGHSCFRLTERNYVTVVTDPFDNKKVGYDPLKLKAEIVTISHDAPGHNNSDAVKGTTHVLTGPGEFEIGGVFITAVQTDSAESKKQKIMSATRSMYLIMTASRSHILATCKRSPPKAKSNCWVLSTWRLFRSAAAAASTPRKPRKLSACWSQISSSPCTIPHLIQKWNLIRSINSSRKWV